MAAKHSASPSCNPPALVRLTLATVCRLALTGWAPSLPLHHSSVPKQLLPRGSWHGTAQHSCGATAHTTAHEAGTQHHKPLPASFRGRSHCQGILNTVLASPWPTPVKVLGGYADQTQELIDLRNKISCSFPLFCSELLWIIYFIRNKTFTVRFCLDNEK